MPHCKGNRGKTRNLFKRPFRGAGPIHLSTYLTTFRLGDVVDIKGNGAVQKGMPHKYYHGRTGTIWNVTRRAVGVEVNKQVRQRIIKKRIHVRVEHVFKSRSGEDFQKRVKENERKKAEARASGKKEKISFKRQPQGPRPGALVNVKKTSVETLYPLRFEELA
eukprot:TRINITY_DN14444_c0_g1_i1.p2 TRINITY_DN14444_c0_g1~~TRINITY_DN14444_c0_g1_i1.p2  ORF type:complete len:163 (-),score=33.03 TRINITY_DN14444_c0_g1_i1:49-537(-)